jgi:hypothetical protein
MLQAGLFPNFKGADSLVIWGDSEGIADLHVALSALAQGVKSTFQIHGTDKDLWIKVSDASDRSKRAQSEAYTENPNASAVSRE